VRLFSEIAEQSQVELVGTLRGNCMGKLAVLRTNAVEASIRSLALLGQRSIRFQMSLPMLVRFLCIAWGQDAWRHIEHVDEGSDVVAARCAGLAEETVCAGLLGNHACDPMQQHFAICPLDLALQTWELLCCAAAKCP
jgi:hypothetical protein